MNEENSLQRRSRIVAKTLPLLREHPTLALKGGTAINYFHRDFPRYSVDIDLTYLPLEDRNTSLKAIADSMQQLQSALTAEHGYRVVSLDPSGQSAATSLRLKDKVGDEVTIETNFVLRGSVAPSTTIRLAPAARAEYKADYSVQTLSLEDTYAGKLIAALSRQHPRDLFDVKLLLEKEGVTPQIKKAFIVYLSSATRPFHELLAPNPIDLSERYNDEFAGMSRIPITLDDLSQTRRKLIPAVQAALNNQDREFLISMANAAPKWELLDVPHAKDLPGMKWKLTNLEKMDKQKRKDQAKQLEKVLAGKDKQNGLDR